MSRIITFKDKTTLEAAYHFLNGIIARLGACAEVVTDGGGEFQAQFDELLLRTMLNHRVTAAHHPHAKGAAGRMVKTIKASINRYMQATDKPVGEWTMYFLGCH